jgi:steroid delta-isomerase-like uncharacterized protein
MSVQDDNKALVRRYFDLLNNLKLPTEAMLAPLDAGFVYHTPGAPDVMGLAGMKEVVDTFRDMSSDQISIIDDLIAEGGKVVCRWSWRGTHDGVAFGVAATGKVLTVTGISIYRIENGKLHEEWNYADVLGVMQQLGANAA